MRDDEDDLQIGKIYHSGIRPEDEIEPADYALPHGEAAVEGWPPERPVSRRLSRRTLLATAGSASVALAFGAGWFWGTSPKPPTRTAGRAGRLTASELELIDATRRWTELPIEKLHENAPALLWVCSVVEPDQPIGHSLTRLCDYAVLRRDAQGAELAAAILAMFDRVGPPQGFARYIEPLQKTLLAWRAERKRGR
ncbi:MAG: hypothetical protein KDC87_10965 [Planctomycetes bacterium]|nr:hypothetical protein [Planctomycetota bacterium]